MATGGENSDCKIQVSRPRKNKHTFFYAATVARSIKHVIYARGRVISPNAVTQT